MSQNQPDALVRRKGDYGSYGRQNNASEDGTGTPANISGVRCAPKVFGVCDGVF
jgi:hypothetical protein